MRSGCDLSAVSSGDTVLRAVVDSCRGTFITRPAVAVRWGWTTAVMGGQSRHGRRGYSIFKLTFWMNKELNHNS